MGSSTQYPPALTPPVEILRQGLNHQIKNPPGGDEYIAAMFSATVKQLEINPFMRDKLNESLPNKRGITAAHLAMLTRVSLQNLATEMEGAKGNFPQGYDEECWTEILEQTFTPDNVALQGLCKNLRERRVGTNLRERYNPPALLRHLAGSRLPEKVRILDLGCSQNLGLITLALKGAQSDDGKPIYPPEMHGRLPKFYRRIDWEKTDDKSKVQAFEPVANVLRQPFGLGPSIGIDITDKNDPGAVRWVRNSFRPKELEDPTTGEQYDFLVDAEPDNVKFYQADVVKFDHGAFGQMLEEQGMEPQFDMAIFSTIMYQLSRVERTVAVSNMRRYIQPDGLIVVQDYIKNNGHFSENWFAKDFTFRTMVLNRNRRGFSDAKEAFISKDGRCGEIVEGKDLASLGLENYKSIIG